jgi:predicted transposase/invertase (TIGR01784 family)
MALATPSILQAIQEVKMFTQDEITRELYESRRKAILDEISKLSDQFEKGKKEGVEIGKKEQAREVAKRLLATGRFTVKEVAEMTGLSPEEIQKC